MGEFAFSVFSLSTSVSVFGKYEPTSVEYEPTKVEYELVEYETARVRNDRNSSEHGIQQMHRSKTKGQERKAAWVNTG